MRELSSTSYGVSVCPMHSSRSACTCPALLWRCRYSQALSPVASMDEHKALLPVYAATLEAPTEEWLLLFTIPPRCQAQSPEAVSHARRAPLSAGGMYPARRKTGECGQERKGRRVNAGGPFVCCPQTRIATKLSSATLGASTGVRGWVVAAPVSAARHATAT